MKGWFAIQEKLSDFRVPRAPMINNCELLEKRDRRFDAARHQRNSFERSSAFDAWRTWNVRAQTRFLTPTDSGRHRLRLPTTRAPRPSVAFVSSTCNKTVIRTPDSPAPNGGFGQLPPFVPGTSISTKPTFGRDQRTARRAARLWSTQRRSLPGWSGAATT